MAAIVGRIDDALPARQAGRDNWRIGVIGASRQRLRSALVDHGYANVVLRRRFCARWPARWGCCPSHRRFASASTNHGRG